MKKFFTLLAPVILSISLLAQPPQKISYQFVIRNAGGALVTNHGIGVKLSILQGTPAGTVVYQEIFNPNPQSNANGLVTVEIGTGLVISGNFSTINWASGPYYLKSEIDPTGATDYTVVGTSQLISVPYSLYSKTTESIPDNIVTSAKIADGAVATVDMANSSVTSAKIADATIATADMADGSVTSAKIADATIATADMADGSVTSAKIADATVATADLSNGSVTSAKITDGTITSADIQDRIRHITFPANALNYLATSTITTQIDKGIKWKSDYLNSAFLSIARPVDWVGTGNVTFKIYFIATTNSAGVVAFFIRPRSYNAGDLYGDASSQSADSPVTIPASSSGRIFSQTFTILPGKFGTKSLWVITIQREGTGETYADDIIVPAVELSYTAEQ